MNKLKELYQKNEEVIVYLIFGVLATVVNILVFFVLDTVMGVHYLAANVGAIVVSILFAFFTNKKYVFKSYTETFLEWFREFTLFCSFRLLSAVIDMLTMWLLVDWLLTDTNLAKVITQFIVVVLNYVFSKFFIFKQEEGK